jgi:squalene synthase HpnC
LTAEVFPAAEESVVIAMPDVDHDGAHALVPADVLQAFATRAAGQMSGENFPVALRALPRAVRADLAAAYVFARFVDDLGDEAPGGPDARLSLLDAVAADVRSLPDGAGLAPVSGLATLVAGYGTPLDTFLDLVEANRADQRHDGCETFDDLLGYCRLSAAPVGRIVLHRARAADPERVRRSDAVCAALQVLEHCQDVAEDAAVGRVYLPAVELRAAGIDASDLRTGSTPPAVRAVVARQVVRSRALLAEGPALVSSLRGWARVAVAGYVAGGLATADALDAADHDVLGRDVRPGKARTAWHALVLLAGRPRSPRWRR